MTKIHFFKQHDSMECGISCLQCICAFWGKEVSVNQLSKKCVMTTEGVSFLSIVETSKSIGLKTHSTRLNADDLTSSMRSPCILHWNQNHFVVLYKVKNGKTFYIADPGK